MPTLIRLLVILLVLAGLVYGGMFALVSLVRPPDKEITVTLRARDLMPSQEREPLVQREIDTSRPITPATAPPAVEAPPADLGEDVPAEGEAAAGGDTPTSEDGSIITLAPGVE
jgi:hypothetical protein